MESVKGGKKRATHAKNKQQQKQIHRQTKTHGLN